MPYCFPYRADYKEGIGRILVATRTIKPMELILVDPGTVKGPNYTTTPACLECLLPVSGYHIVLLLRSSINDVIALVAFCDDSTKVFTLTNGEWVTYGEPLRQSYCWCCNFYLNLLKFLFQVHKQQVETQKLFDRVSFSKKLSSMSMCQWTD